MMIEKIMRKSTTLLIGLLTLASIVVVPPCNGRTSLLCQESERQALLRFKQDIEDPSNRLSSWSAAEKECCQWVGVICDNMTGHVKELHLDNPLHSVVWETQAEAEAFERFQLRGKINPSLMDLKHLSYLDLSYNDFGGIQFPSFIGSLKKLRYLNLSEAGFGGLVPHQLGNLSNLRNLGIRGTLFREANLYVKSLHWLYGLSSLEHLDMSRVNLSVASDWLTGINSLPSLLELHLSECTLQVFPSLSSVNFTSLSILDLSRNRFQSAIPKWVFSLPNLISLRLSVNVFEGPIPIGLRNLTRIRNLHLYENNFNSTIPDWLYNLESLENLDLFGNNLQGLISAAIKNFTSVRSFDLSYNELEAKIPKEMGNLCNLKSIMVDGNKLGGSISEAFESLSGCLSSSLESLSMSGNNFSGHLPDTIGKFKHLRVLDLWGNLISGPIPSSLGSLSSLEFLALDGNRLTGTIPESIGNLSRLEELVIGDNMLEGVLTEIHFENLTSLRELYASNNYGLTLKVGPAWVPSFRLTRLKLTNWNLGPKFPLWLQSQDDISYLDLSSTGIADSIPTWFWNITSKIGYLNLSHNQIGGELPADLSFSQQFTDIYLGSNKMKGALPCITANVTVLDLSNNSFSGTISRFLCNPKGEPNALKILDLGENGLSGEIPDCWMKWKSLRVIELGNNNLIGKIPISIGYLLELQSLHLRNNNLSGGVPESLKNCSELLTLDFGHNKFVGSIPVWLAGNNLPKLKVLSLRLNMFKGAIPPELCSLASLQILDVADNNLSGEVPKCVGNFKAMITRNSSGNPIVYYSLYYSSIYGVNSSYYGVFLENAFVVIKGREIQYDTILTLATSIDMSNNDMSGGIPEEVTALLGLQSLNLSRNRLTGPIPNKIGDMQFLESADLSRNQLTGRIPSSMSSMHFLSYLDLSNNNLSGEIPLSTQLQSLDASSFLGNALCGPPLMENCSRETAPPSIRNKNEKGSDGVGLYEFYLSMLIGFGASFFGFWGPLIFISSCRQAYFRLLDQMWHTVSSKFCKQTS